MIAWYLRILSPRESKGFKVHILLGGKDAKQTLIQHTVHIAADRICNQFLNLFHIRADRNA